MKMSINDSVSKSSNSFDVKSNQSDLGKASNSGLSSEKFKMPSWWPFTWNPSACSSSSAKGSGSGIMKKEDIKL